jgi:hypothetical protein
MAKRERLRRQDPKRMRPIRNATNYLRDSHSWPNEPQGAGRQSDRRKESGSLEDVVTDGVKLGYKVIENYLRQGQRTAEWIRNTAQEQGSKGGNTEELLEGVLRLYKDMTDIWIDAVAIIVRSPAFLTWLTGAEERTNGSGPPQKEHEQPIPADGAATKLTIEILSAKRAQVTLNLGRTPTRYTPLVHALYASDPSIPPLTGISFRLERKSMVPILRLKIPAKQPAGTYTGVIVDGQTNEPKGTLYIHVLA